MRKTVAADGPRPAPLRTLYTAATDEEAGQWLAEFDAKWGVDCPSIVQSWRHNWKQVIPFFDYPVEIRKMIYTTTATAS